MKELRELVKKYQECFCHYNEKYNKENEIYKQGVLHGQSSAFLQAKNLLEQAIEAQEKREAEKIALIDKEIEECSKYCEPELMSGLLKAKSIMQGGE